VSPDVRAAHVADALDAMGVRDRCISRLTQFLPGRTVVGTALTLACAPPGGADTARYAGLLAAIDAVKAGDVVVVASGPSDAAAVWGELLSTACLARGAVGAVTDGLIRDSVQTAALGFPVFARGTSPLDIHGRLDVVAHGVDVHLAGVQVATGDTIVADADGVVVLPREHAAEALERAAAKAVGEADFRAAVTEGATATEAFRRFDVL
jgi:4-hydroxy-4-methyl-2-oxoglutarate aldolase